MTSTQVSAPAVSSKIRNAIRSAARHAALDALSLVGQSSGRAGQAMRIPRVHFLYLHAVPSGQLSAFRDLVARLTEDHELVSYSAAVSLLAVGDVSSPVVTFSFDDGFVSNMAAARVLEDFGTTACFFVPTGFVGCKTVTDARRFFGVSDGVDEIAMTWDDLAALTDRGHEIGNHTFRHRVLSRVSLLEAYDEVAKARETLRARLGQGDHFAWPRGRFEHFTPEAARAVFETGHLSCASAERGSHLATALGGVAPPCIRRDHLMTSWPLRHNLYFVSAGARCAGRGAWPAGWAV